MLNFIKAGNFSKVVSDAIVDAEDRSGKLKGEIEGLEYQKQNAFKAPPREWIEHQLGKFKETLDMNTKASALALKELLGTVEMEPIGGECVVKNGNLVQVKPYCVAYSNIQTFALLEESKGSNWLHCRKR